uniref:N(6)-L-threonylcarbamoyladenine synthase n=1 Tax=Parascaris equorum TaxID=6256 RepID=A0A914SEQ2_PAREQ
MVSCDDTAVCILSGDRRVLSSRRYANREVQNRLGGICPSLAAEQHRSYIDRFVNECLKESGRRLSDLDAVAVTTRPGLVIALKVGISKALSLAREGHIQFVNVHHMQAHATVASLLYPQLHYPYVCVLISGGHALIAVAYGPADFDILASSLSGSPGECLDKLARALPPSAFQFGYSHLGAALEQLASNALQKVGGAYGYSVLAPPARLCCDNAEMVAWNGIELIRTRSAIPFSTRIVPVLGIDLLFILCSCALVAF